MSKIILLWQPLIPFLAMGLYVYISCISWFSLTPLLYVMIDLCHWMLEIPTIVPFITVERVAH